MVGVKHNFKVTSPSSSSNKGKHVCASGVPSTIIARVHNLASTSHELLNCLILLVDNMRQWDWFIYTCAWSKI